MNVCLFFFFTFFSLKLHSLSRKKSSNEGDSSENEVEMRGGNTIVEVGIGGPQLKIFNCPSTIIEIYERALPTKKPLLQYVTPRGPKKKKAKESRVWDCHVYLTNFRGSYTRVKSHFLGIACHGVKACPELTQQEMVECHRLHIEAEIGKRSGAMLAPSSASAQSSMPTSSTDTIRSSHIGTRGKRKVIGSDMGGSVEGMFNVQARETIESSITKFFFANTIPFHEARSTYFKQMVKDIATIGPSFVPRGDHKLRPSPPRHIVFQG